MENKKPEIYTAATAHLDTSWLWSLEQTIEEYLPDTLIRNFEFIEKFKEKYSPKISGLFFEKAQ